jgi:four helix bundle protein
VSSGALKWFRARSGGDTPVTMRAQLSGMSPYRDLRVLAAAEEVAAEVLTLSDVHFRAQLQESAEGVPANIREAFGRGNPADRKRVLLIARGQAEKAIGHLAANFSAGRIDEKMYWRMRHRLTTIVKMLNSIMA